MRNSQFYASGKRSILRSWYSVATTAWQDTIDVNTPYNTRVWHIVLYVPVVIYRWTLHGNMKKQHVPQILWHAIIHPCPIYNGRLTKPPVHHQVISYDVDFHDDVIKWKHFPRNWPFVRGIHRSSVNSPHKGQWRGALMFSLICVWINGWVNNREAGDLRRYRAHFDVTVMISMA